MIAVSGLDHAGHDTRPDGQRAPPIAAAMARTSGFMK